MPNDIVTETFSLNTADQNNRNTYWIWVNRSLGYNQMFPAPLGHGRSGLLLFPAARLRAARWAF